MAFIGVSQKAQKVLDVYIGVDGVAQKVVRAYVGDADGIARIWWGFPSIPKETRLASLSQTVSNIDYYYLNNTRVITFMDDPLAFKKLPEGITFAADTGGMGYYKGTIIGDHMYICGGGLGSIICDPNMTKCFEAFVSLETINGMELLDTSEIIDLSRMFCECRSLTSIDLSHFSNYSAKNYTRMFNNCSSLTEIDITNLFTTGGSLVSGGSRVMMFDGCSALQTIKNGSTGSSEIKISSPTDCDYMFANCSSLTTIPAVNIVSAGSDFPYLFFNCSSLTSMTLKHGASGFADTNMRSVFENCSSLTTVTMTAFNNTKALDMSRFFYNCSKMKNIYVNSSIWIDWDYSSQPDKATDMYSGCGVKYVSYR